MRRGQNASRIRHRYPPEPGSNSFYRPVKKQLTVRLDSDVIAWLQKKGKGYQTRMNKLLRAAMLKEMKSGSRA